MASIAEVTMAGGIGAGIGVSLMRGNAHAVVMSRARNRALVGNGNGNGNASGWKRVAITCAAAKSESQSALQSTPLENNSVNDDDDDDDLRRINPAEELLERWATQPAASSGGRSSETEAVRRLFVWDALPKQQEVQVFSIYEINEHDRDSPAFFPFSTINVSKSSTNTSYAGFLHNLWSTLSGGHQHGLGDIVPFSNKIYDSSLRTRLGVTAGMTMVVKTYPGKGHSHHVKQQYFFPDRYEAMYTFYLGDMGHVSAQGPFCTFEDTLLTVTGGAGMFREASGVIHLHNITPFKLFYTFHVKGVPELPSVLTSPPVQPSEFVQPCRDAVACKPGFALPNYTD